MTINLGSWSLGGEFDPNLSSKVDAILQKSQGSTVNERFLQDMGVDVQNIPLTDKDIADIIGNVFDYDDEYTSVMFHGTSLGLEFLTQEGASFTEHSFSVNEWRDIKRVWKYLSEKVNVFTFIWNGPGEPLTYPEPTFTWADLVVAQDIRVQSEDGTLYYAHVWEVNPGQMPVICDLMTLLPLDVSSNWKIVEVLDIGTT